jgi:hypothetical protein
MPFDYGRFEIIEEPWPEGELKQLQARTGDGWLLARGEA